MLLVLATAALAKEIYVEFIFTHTAEVASTPRLVERETRIEVSFNTETMTGVLKYYSPFSDNFEISTVSVKAADEGLHFIGFREKGFEVLSFGMIDSEAIYSSSTVHYGINSSYQLYGQGRFLEKH